MASAEQLAAELLNMQIAEGVSCPEQHDGFIFDPVKHLYIAANGMAVPSVTQCLKAEGIVDFSRVPWRILEHKRQIGNLVHKATELYDRGENLNEYELPDEIMPYIEGYVNFRADCNFTPEGIEHRMLADYMGMRYGMTYDRRGEICGIAHMLELKCGASEDPAWGLQLAAYCLGVGNKKLTRAAVQLGPQFPRKYRIHSYEDAADYQIWLNTLANTVWKQNHGKLVLDPIEERLTA